jgi:hypothetical protein
MDRDCSKSVNILKSLVDEQTELTRQINFLDRQNYHSANYPQPQEYIDLKERVTEVKTKIRDINKYITDNNRDLISSMALLPTDTVIDMSNLLALFHNTIISNISKTLIPTDILSELSKKQEKIIYITKNIPKEVYLAEIRNTIRKLPSADINKIIKYIKSNYGMLLHIKLNIKVTDRRNAVIREIYKMFLTDPSKRKTYKLPINVTKQITEYTGNIAGRTYKKKTRLKKKIPNM